MIYYILLAISILLAVCKSSLYNSYAKRNTPTLRETFSFNAVSYGAATVIALIGMLFSSEGISLTTVICAFFLISYVTHPFIKYSLCNIILPCFF